MTQVRHSGKNGAVRRGRERRITSEISRSVHAKRTSSASGERPDTNSALPSRRRICSHPEQAEARTNWTKVRSSAASLRLDPFQPIHPAVHARRRCVRRDKLWEVCGKSEKKKKLFSPHCGSVTSEQEELLLLMTTRCAKLRVRAKLDQQQAGARRQDVTACSLSPPLSL